MCLEEAASTCTTAELGQGADGCLPGRGTSVNSQYKFIASCGESLLVDMLDLRENVRDTPYHWVRNTPLQ